MFEPCLKQLEMSISMRKHYTTIHHEAVQCLAYLSQTGLGKLKVHKYPSGQV